jgi:hypothetical protein
LAIFVLSSSTVSAGPVVGTAAALVSVWDDARVIFGGLIGAPGAPIPIKELPEQQQRKFVHHSFFAPASASTRWWMLD